MEYAISAGVIVVRDGSLLLVHHQDGGDDFWLPPGGRLRGEESIFECAARETFEETGLCVVPQRVLYVEEFVEAKLHFCKFWLLAPDPGGDPNVAQRDPDEVHLVAARFFPRAAIRGLLVFPAVLRHAFWDDLARGFAEPRYLGLTRIGPRGSSSCATVDGAGDR